MGAMHPTPLDWSDVVVFGAGGTDGGADGGAGGGAARPSLHARMKVCHNFCDAPRTARRWRPPVRQEDVEEYRKHDLHGHLVRQLTQLGTPRPPGHTGHWPSVLYVCERPTFKAAIETGVPVADVCGPEHILRMIAMLRRAVAPVSFIYLPLQSVRILCSRFDSLPLIYEHLNV